jgi:hypothetical protein
MSSENPVVLIIEYSLPSPSGIWQLLGWRSHKNNPRRTDAEGRYLPPMIESADPNPSATVHTAETSWPAGVKSNNSILFVTKVNGSGANG